MEVGNPNVDIVFKGGRVDCPTSPQDSDHHDFPDPAMSRTQMMNWFAENESGFSMNENEVR